MAGIGFELKRIFKKDSLGSILSGAAYSTVVVIGPTLIVMLTLLFLYSVLGFMEIPYTQRELVSGAILYIFLFAVIITTPINTVISRYIADRLFEEEFEDILPSFYTGLLICLGVGTLLSAPFIIRLVVVGNVEIVFATWIYVLFVAVLTAFFAMTYLTATKDYRLIAIDFIVGMVTAVIWAVVGTNVFQVEIIYAIMSALAIGFSVIALMLVAYVKHYFRDANENYFGCFSYFMNMKRLFFGSLLYVLGIYVHNFIFWAQDGSLVVANSFSTNQAYDMAACLGMFTNISCSVIYTIMSETSFHEAYQKYVESIIGGVLKDIELTKKNMFKLLNQQIGYVVRIQAIISIILFLLIIIFLPDYGFSGLEMTIYPGLAAAFFGIYTMYCNNIFLCYFNDNTGTFFTGLIFFVGTVLGTLVSCRLEPQFYGLGALFGALSGWTYSYFRIRFLERNFDYHIMCSMHVIKVNKGEKPSSLVYKKQR